jgi:neuropeptide S receptor 1
LAFLWILLILIVVGNMAVLVALSMSSARKSRMNYFIKHLAIAGNSIPTIQYRENKI